MNSYLPKMLWKVWFDKIGFNLLPYTNNMCHSLLFKMFKLYKMKTMKLTIKLIKVKCQV